MKTDVVAVVPRTGTAPAHRIGTDSEAIEVAHALAAAFAVGAAERDRLRQLPHEEIERFSASGLWAIAVPRAFGGAELSYRTVAKMIEIISAADPSIGQIPQNHLSVAFQIQSLGSEAQRRYFFDLILNGARFGNALAELTDKAAHQFETVMTPVQRDGQAGYEINGRKFYSTGALFADFISVGALDSAGRRYTAIVPRNAPGLTVSDDWSSFGQRTTASGTVILERVFVPESHVLPLYLVQERPVPNGAVAQIIQAAIDSGIAVAAVEDTKRLVREVARPWRDSGSPRAADDPYTIATIGRLEIALHAAQALLDRAGGFVDRSIAAPTEGSVAEASIAVAEAKVLTTEIALEASNVLFELAGTRVTLEPHRFDRHWRNARVHTLHDPVRWKYNVIGDWALNAKAPPRHGLV
ncbi:MAG TPA: SfnB family sulfur acquisition oxidoreductase [Acidocella sp.]|nr:SfnB family sulfur acquisition oxidoreductase [Acidocella sp.]